MTEFQYATPPRFTCQKCKQECLSLLLEGGRYQCLRCVQLYRKRQEEIAEQLKEPYKTPQGTPDDVSRLD